ncbi:MAG: AI-2E family transporter [Bacteroidales bacterium]|nr:AI-2E family transporter [Bacteroidales bacterium]
MSKIEEESDHKPFTKKTIEAAIRIAVLALLIGWCFIIIQPFIIILAWAVIIAVAVYPLYKFLRKKFGNRKKLAATTVTLLFLAVFIVPGSFLTKSLVNNIGQAKEYLKDGQIVIPPPKDNIKSWPLIGKPIYNTWYHATVNLEEVLKEYAPQLKVAGLWLFENLSNAGVGMLQFILSIILCGGFLAYSEPGGKVAEDIGIRLMGEKGKEFIKDSELTIRNVARGILGIAFFQAILVGIGLVIAGVPLAGLWAVISLMLAIMQLGLGPVTIPIIIYMFSTSDPLTATLLAIWLVFVSLIDNVIKPMVLGHKSPVPSLVIFLGAIGGFMANGIIGLFLGAVVLSLGYKLFMWWLVIENIPVTNNTEQLNTEAIKSKE